MNIKLIGNPKVIMSNPDSRHGYFAWPTAALLQDGKIAVGASGFRIEHVCPFGKGVLSYSFDGGETYTYPAPVIDTPLDDRDVGICPFGESGVIMTSFNNSADFQREYIDIIRVRIEVNFRFRVFTNDTLTKLNSPVDIRRSVGALRILLC